MRRVGSEEDREARLGRLLDEAARHPDLNICEFVAPYGFTALDVIRAKVARTRSTGPDRE